MVHGRLLPACRITQGDTVGHPLYLPGIKLSPAATLLPFNLRPLQFPVKLALAMTIDKSHADIWSGCSFAVGMRYMLFHKANHIMLP
jgi:hypothetical protein